MKMKLIGIAAAAAAIASLSGQAWADDAACKTVKFADVGWSDIAATTGMASVVLEGLGYKPTVTIASIPIAFAGMKKKQIDVFLGYWNPSMTPQIEPFVKAGDIKVLDTPNLVGAKYTLAVPTYLFDKGLKTFADIAKFEKDLGGKIYGIEPGNDGNALIAGMIKDNKFGLKNFKMVESSEAGMLIEAQAREYLTEESLTALEAEFGERFVRIHRNALVARAFIAGFQRVKGRPEGEGEAPEGHWEILLRDMDERLPISRRQWPTVKALAGF